MVPKFKMPAPSIYIFIIAETAKSSAHHNQHSFHLVSAVARKLLHRGGYFLPRGSAARWHIFA